MDIPIMKQEAKVVFKNGKRRRVIRDWHLRMGKINYALIVRSVVMVMRSIGSFIKKIDLSKMKGGKVSSKI